MTKALGTRGRARCSCGAVMCQSNGGEPFCPSRHSKHKRPILTDRPIKKYHELSKAEKKARREHIRKTRTHVPAKKGKGFGASLRAKFRS